MGFWGRYVPVSERRTNARKQIEKLKRKGWIIEPIEIEGRTIAKEFWGKKWCDHLDTFADDDDRLSRGKTYVRNGSVCHLSLQKGKCTALVSGSELYEVLIDIKPLADEAWEEIKRICKGKIGSLLELLQGKFSKNMMEIVADSHTGLFPKEKEITFSCSCPDWAGMCKHIAAVCYGIGKRLDDQPELLFHLRSVDPSELIATELTLATGPEATQLQGEDLAALFDIDLEQDRPKAALLTQQPEPTLTKKPHSKKTPQPKPVQRLSVANLTGTQLKKFREEKKLTVLQLANALSVTPASIYRWEDKDQVLNLNRYSKETLKHFIESHF